MRRCFNSPATQRERNEVEQVLYLRERGGPGSYLRLLGDLSEIVTGLGKEIN